MIILYIYRYNYSIIIYYDVCPVYRYCTIVVSCRGFLHMYSRNLTEYLTMPPPLSPMPLRHGMRVLPGPHRKAPSYS